MAARRVSADRTSALAARWTITVPGATIPASPFPPGSHPGNDKILVVWPDVPPGLDKTALASGWPHPTRRRR
jgi:hypothetical protein